ncbi:MAG: rhomboid family intramembrane serine protease [Pseudobdellovibrio sp.]
MIVPGDFKNFTVKPFFKFSWVVLILNLIVYAVIANSFPAWPTPEMSEKLSSEKFKKAVYEMYLQTLDPIENRLKLPVDQVYTKAIRDEKFWNRVQTFPFKGDQVEIEEVRSTITEFYKTYHDSAQAQFGLGGFEATPWSWVTYQFVHASFAHLFGNLMIIFLIISYLEKTVSIGWLTVVYLFSGFAGGVFFLLFDSSGTMSVVGASASASGLLGFLVISQHSQLMPWFYMIAPIKEGFGKIYLPVFFIFPIFLMSDFVSLLSEPNGVATNIAVSAHVGGTLTGMILGAIYLLLLRSKTATHSIFSYHDRLNELT